MIHCEDVWIQFRRNMRLRQTLKHTLASFFTSAVAPVDFWGLSGVSFHVKKGGVMGVVGVNGSGKSTLLKTLCGVLRPDRGRVRVNGRICPLLEVGTGFEPELSGGENIFLNGAVLGIKKRELKERFRDIVEFAELEDFIDTPLKHYSTGMRMRLGFAIAAHGRPEVLLVDEVLAVGDRAFQTKCVDTIMEMRRQGVTILFVSHTMDTVRHLCDSALWLQNGQAMAQGETGAVVDSYLKESDRHEKEQMEKKAARLPRANPDLPEQAGFAAVKNVRLLDRCGNETARFRPFEELRMAIAFTAAKRIDNPIFGVAIHRLDGVHICGPNTRECSFPVGFIEGGGEIELRIPSLHLLSGVYLVTAGIFDAAHAHAFDYRDRAWRFEVEFSALPGQRGLVAMDYQWRLSQTSK